MSLLAELNFNLAEKLAGQYRWSEAPSRFVGAIRLNPFSSKYVSGYAEFLRKSARYLYDKTDVLNKAIGLYDKAIALDPENAEYYLKRGLARLEAGRSVKEAFKDLHEAYLHDPNGYSIAYAIGYTGMNFWKSLDDKERNFVTERLAYIMKTSPDQAQKVYDAVWRASKDINLLKKITADARQNTTELYRFIAADNLWQYRKEIAGSIKEDTLVVTDIKSKILEAEKFFEAGAWKRVEGRTVLAEDGEKILESAKARYQRRKNGVVATDDWVLISKDYKNISYANGVLYSNSTAYAILNVPAGDSLLILEAKGSPFKSIWPYLVVEVDGQEIGEAFVETAQIATYEFPLRSQGGLSLIGVRFVNDAYDPRTGEDRNLWLGKAEVRVKTEAETK
ncbi:MAG: tetratricopeptide repeat protein [Candidatus Omnitrophica bacterium]|nr:tetratricopeptide repeat protein [Candidatus Omnitrophota bacterium]